jgi:hypothetical protein
LYETFQLLVERRRLGGMFQKAQLELYEWSFLILVCLLSSIYLPFDLASANLSLNIAVVHHPASRNMFWYTKSGCPAYYKATVEYIVNTFSPSYLVPQVSDELIGLARARVYGLTVRS